MALDFNRINRAAAFNPVSAFPLDARGYFESYDAALEAARKAKPAGDTTTLYHYGLHVVVVENNEAKFYIIQPPRIEGDLPYLREAGGAVQVDNVSLERDADTGAIKLRAFNKEYYRYNIKTKEEVLAEGRTAADFPGYVYQDGAFWYESQLNDGTYSWVALVGEPSTHKKVQGFIEGLEQRTVMENGQMVSAWFESDAIQVKELSSKVATLNERVAQNTDDISEIKSVLTWTEMQLL